MPEVCPIPPRLGPGSAQVPPRFRPDSTQVPPRFRPGSAQVPPRFLPAFRCSSAVGLSPGAGDRSAVRVLPLPGRLL